MSRNDKTMEQIKEICKWVDDNGDVPNTRSKDEYEKVLGKKLSTLKTAKLGRGVFLESYTTEATKMGYPKLFDKADPETNGLEMITKLCDFIDENGRNPFQKSENKLEAKLAEKLTTIKKAKKGKGGKYFESYTNLIEKRGYPTLFDTKKKGESTKWTN